MAGTFTAMDKVRPGAYYRFKAARQLGITVGTRGIVAFPFAATWGPINQLIGLPIGDYLGGELLNKIGVDATDPEAVPFREAFKNAVYVYTYRLGGPSAVAATVTLDTDAAVVAKYPGTLGNDITIVTVANATAGADHFDVITLVKNRRVDAQTIQYWADFIANDWITVTDSGTSPGTQITATAGTALTGGVDPTAQQALADYPAMFTALKTKTFQVFAAPTTESTVPPLVANFVKSMREVEGRMIQGVVYDSDADYEGIISVDQGYKIGDETIPPATFICWVAGATAGATYVTSNTYKVVAGATEIINPKNNEQIVDGLTHGKFIISQRLDLSIVVEKDINSLHTFTADRTYPFSKNRVIRTLDDIIAQINSTFENSFIGKVDNNAQGREVFRSAVAAYLKQLDDTGAIQNFAPSSDLEVLAGPDIESVICNIWVQPVDALEKLYLTVTVA